MVSIIAGSSTGVTIFFIFIFCFRKKSKENKEKAEAAKKVEETPHYIDAGSEEKKLVMKDFSAEEGVQAMSLGYVFASKMPRAGIESQFAGLMKGTITPRNGYPEFGQYSDVTSVSFSKLKPVGSGAFGFIYRVKLAMGVVAIKVPKQQIEPDSEEYYDIMQEAELLQKLRHTNITLLLGYGNHPCGSVIFLMEFADFSLADSLKSGPLKIENLVEHAHSIIRGLLYLHIHSPPISHRDLKPENVLIIEGVAKLADFGLATARDFVSKSTGFAGTPIWSPPEAFDGKFPGPPGDIYAFGLLLWAMFTGKTPYEGKTFNEILMLKAKNQLPDIPPDCPVALSKMMNKSWKTNPTHRIIAPALEIHFRDIRKI